MNSKTNRALYIFLSGFFALVMSLSLAAQNGTVSGKVTDKNNAPLAKASITVKGQSTATATDEQGLFTLQNVPASGTLAISFIGYATQEVKFTAGRNLNILLEEATKEADEIIVTGVFDKRKKLESSVAITTLNNKDIERMAPTSSADLLKNIPGVYVNQARGEIWNTVYSRGISAGSIDNANGYYYVGLQEDGLPVININAGVDYFLRADATTNRVEAVRGGTASILGANAPGGIFNYISKTGGPEFGGEIRAKFGLEGDGKNPYYRVDGDFGGALSKDKSLTYNIGGFYRRSDGARNPGYPMNNGGQVKANIFKTYKSGSLKLFAKYLNDRNAVMEFIPTQGWTDPKIPSGFSKYDSYYLPDVTLQLPINQNGYKTFRSTDKIHSQDKSVGFNWTQNLNNGFTIRNDARYASKSVSQNIPAVVTPFATDNLLFYAIPHLLGKFGTYTFTDKVTGQTLGTITQAPNIIDGNFAGFQFIPGEHNNFPGSNVQPNSLFFLPMFYSSSDINEFVDQFSISKKTKNMNFVLGGFYGHTKDNIIGVSQDFGIGGGTMQDQPHLTDITLAGFDGKTYQVTDPNGFMDVGRDGANLATTTLDMFAVYFGHNWQINPQFNLDWGVRFESNHNFGFNKPAVPNPDRNDPTYGGRDGNPLTLYDNGGGIEGQPLNYDETLNTFSFSGALSYKISNNQSIYVRYSNGNKAPDVNFYLALNTPYAIANTKPYAQKVEQWEAGYKLNAQRLKLFITPFYSVLSNVPNIQTFTDTNGTNYSPAIQFAKYRTFGVEIEASYAFTTHFAVKAGATFQNSKAVEYKTWQSNANGKADDVLVDYSGNETDNNARAIFHINPMYSAGKFFAAINWSYMGARQANIPNAFRMPAFNTTDLTIGYDVTRALSLQLNINNLFDTYGVLGWSGPGGFPAALDRQGFTREYIEANPNAIYATQGSMPRAYFLTATYRF